MFGKYTRGPFGHPTHRDFNKRFEDRIADSNSAERPWLSNESLAVLPPVGSEFQHARDPFIAKQMDDLGKTEAQRREEQARGSSKMVGKDRPRLNLRPPPAIAKAADERAFRTSWLKEQRNAAMAQADLFERNQRQTERDRQLPARERDFNR